MFKFGLQAVSDSGGHIRRLVSRIEFEEEAQWRDKFQWNPLVFPLAMPSATCTLQSMSLMVLVVRDAQGCLQMQAYDLAHVVLTSSSLDSSQIDNV